MIRYFLHNQIDFKKWDHCVSKSINSLIYGYSWYLDIVCKNWNALIEDDYKAVFPLTGNNKYGIHYLYPPPFTQQLGIFSPFLLNPEDVIAFIHAIPSHYRFIDINLNYMNRIEHPDYFTEKQLNHVLDLSEPYDIIYKNYSQNTKRNIKNAVSSEIKLSSSFAPTDIIELFRTNRGRTLTHLSAKHYHILEQLIKEIESRGYAQCEYAVTAKGELCAGVVWGLDKKRAVFLFSATAKQAKQSGAMSWLIDHFIKNRAGTPRLIDFEGSNNPGLARFYKSFGSKEENYLKLKINKLPAFMKLIKH